MRNGERNGRAKLTWEKVEEIRDYYQKYNRKNCPVDHTSTYLLAEDYGVTQSTLHSIVSFQTWIKK